MLTEKEWREKVDSAYDDFTKTDTKETYNRYMEILSQKPDNAPIGVKEAIIYAQHRSLQFLIDERNQLMKENMVLKQLLNVIEVQEIDLELRPDDATIN